MAIIIIVGLPSRNVAQGMDPTGTLEHTAQTKVVLSCGPSIYPFMKTGV